jgi:hypothetical protein
VIPAVRYRPAGMRVIVAFVLALTVLAGCGDDGDGAAEVEAATDAPSVDGATDAADGPRQPLPVPDVEPPAPGAARVVVGGSLDVEPVVESCTLDPAAQPADQVPASQVMVRAAGARPDGVPVVVDISRFRSRRAAATITATITILEGTEATPVRLLQAQRFGVGAEASHPRDPEADDPLLRVAGPRIEARGVFAAPGSFADAGGLVEGLVSATCTG